MKAPAAHRLPMALLVALFLMPGCGDDSPNKPPDTPPGDLAPDFTLTDVNENSATFSQDVSPRQHLGAVSAWYFGAAT